jgi:C-terminal processing protease CtpA/Prc
MPTVSFLDRQGYLSGEERAGPVVIDKVLDDSLASEVGLTPGDEVVRVAGQPVDAMNLPDLLK